MYFCSPFVSLIIDGNFFHLRLRLYWWSLSIYIYQSSKHIHLLTYLSTCLSIYLSYPFIYLSSPYLSVSLPTHLSIYLRTYLPIYLSFLYLFLYLPSPYLSVPIYLRTYLCIYLSMCVCFYVQIDRQVDRYCWFRTIIFPCTIFLIIIL